MLRDPKLAQDLRRRTSANEGVLVTAFSFPVVPRGQDRIRAPVVGGPRPGANWTAPSRAFADVGRKLGIID